LRARVRGEETKAKRKTTRTCVPRRLPTRHCYHYIHVAHPYAPVLSSSAFTHGLHLHSLRIPVPFTYSISFPLSLASHQRTGCMAPRIDTPLPPSVPSLANRCIASRRKARFHESTLPSAFLSHSHVFLPAPLARLVEGGGTQRTRTRYHLDFISLLECKVDT
jgi:hypothetical protein